MNDPFNNKPTSWCLIVHYDLLAKRFSILKSVQPFHPPADVCVNNRATLTFGFWANCWLSIDLSPPVACPYWWLLLRFGHQPASWRLSAGGRTHTLYGEQGSHDLCDILHLQRLLRGFRWHQEWTTKKGEGQHRCCFSCAGVCFTLTLT